MEPPLTILGLAERSAQDVPRRRSAFARWARHDRVVDFAFLAVSAALVIRWDGVPASDAVLGAVLLALVARAIPVLWAATAEARLSAALEAGRLEEAARLGQGLAAARWVTPNHRVAAASSVAFAALLAGHAHAAHEILADIDASESMPRRDVDSLRSMVALALLAMGRVDEARDACGAIGPGQAQLATRLAVEAVGGDPHVAVELAGQVDPLRRDVPDSVREARRRVQGVEIAFAWQRTADLAVDAPERERAERARDRALEQGAGAPLHFMTFLAPAWSDFGDFLRRMR